MLTIKPAKESPGFTASLQNLFVTRPWVGVALISIIYWTLSFVMARRILWLDEFLTLYDVNFKSFGDVWRFMMDTADQTPPYFMLVTHASFRLFGNSDLGLRFPAMIGFWVAMLCLYRIVSRWSSPASAIVAMSFPMATPAFYYAAEARCYGLLLGVSAMALLCWLEIDATSAPRRLFATFALGASLALATCCHYYSVLLPVAFAVGELVLLRKGHPLRWKVWLAFTAVLLPLWPVYASIVAARASQSAYWLKPQLYFGITWFDLFLSGAPILAIIVVFLAGRKDKLAKIVSVPSHAMAALVVLLCLPLLLSLVAYLFTGAYAHRYAISAILAVAVLYSLVIATIDQGIRSAVFAISIFVIFSVDFTQRQIHESRALVAALQGCRDMVKNSGLPAAPVLYGGLQPWVRVKHYRWLLPDNEPLYPIDTQHDEGSSHGLAFMVDKYRRVLPSGAVDFESLGINQKHYNICLENSFEDHWLVPALVKKGWTVKAVGDREDGWLFQAESNR